MKITKQFKAEIAHRLVDAYSTNCMSIHGHSYIFRVTLESDTLDSTGMVMDFGRVKSKLSTLFDSWDHSFMFYSEDILKENYLGMLDKMPLRMVEVDYNPTAENMAYHIFKVCKEAKLPIAYVEVQETLTGWARADKPLNGVGDEVTYYNV